MGHKQVILYKLNINEFVLLTKWGITTIIRLFKQILSLETLKQSFSRDANFVIFFINRTKITFIRVCYNDSTLHTAVRNSVGDSINLCHICGFTCGFTLIAFLLYEFYCMFEFNNFNQVQVSGYDSVDGKWAVTQLCTTCTCTHKAKTKLINWNFDWDS